MQLSRRPERALRNYSVREACPRISIVVSVVGE